MHTKPSAAMEVEAAQELRGIESHDALTTAMAIRDQFIEPRRGGEIGSKTSAVEHALRWSPSWLSTTKALANSSASFSNASLGSKPSPPHSCPYPSSAAAPASSLTNDLQTPAKTNEEMLFVRGRGKKP